MLGGVLYRYHILLQLFLLPNAQKNYLQISVNIKICICSSLNFDREANMDTVWVHIVGLCQ